jgi:capsular polysaccharide transport system ATP-binding protein
MRFGSIIYGTSPSALEASEFPSYWGLLDCEHYFKTAEGFRMILAGTSLLLSPLSKTSILVAPGAGKTTLIRLLTGLETPRSGRLLGQRGDALLLSYAGHLHPLMTGEENVRNVARLYGLEPDEVLWRCLRFVDLQPLIRNRINSYSATAKTLLAYALNLQLPCRFLLAKDRFLIGSERVRRELKPVLEQALETRGLILIGSSPRIGQQVSEQQYVLKDGLLLRCHHHAQAVTLYRRAVDEDLMLPSEIDPPNPGQTDGQL